MKLSFESLCFPVESQPCNDDYEDAWENVYRYFAIFNIFEVMESISLDNIEPSLELTALYTFDKELISPYEITLDKLRHIRALYKKEIIADYKNKLHVLCSKCCSIFRKASIGNTPFHSQLITQTDVTSVKKIHDLIAASIGASNVTITNVRRDVQLNDLRNAVTACLSSFATNRGIRRKGADERTGRCFHISEINDMVSMLDVYISTLFDRDIEVLNKSRYVRPDPSRARPLIDEIACRSMQILAILHSMHESKGTYQLYAYDSELNDEFVSFGAPNIRRLLNESIRESRFNIASYAQLPLDVSVCIDPNNGSVSALDKIFKFSETQLFPQQRSQQIAKARYWLEDWRALCNK